MVDTLEDFKKQHFDNYKQSILDTIVNNTNVLIDDDIMSLFRKPPLDSMDSIKVKYIDLAKKNKVVIDVEKLDKILEGYRKDIIKLCEKIKKMRIDTLSKSIEGIELVKSTDVYKINKKDFNELDKKIKKILKDELIEIIDNKFILKIDTVFSGNIDEDNKKKINDEISKFVKNTYLKQLLDSVDFKLLVKDTILGNSLKEQGERYLFTLANSRIFKQE